MQTATERFQFQTFGDPQLVKMLQAAERFANDLKAGKSPYWLSLVGASGTGKTHLAKQLKEPA